MPAGHILAVAAAALALLAAAPARADVGILAIGDFGVGGERQRLTGEAVQRFAASPRPADALVTLGDNDYTERPAAFRANWLGSFGWAAADGLLVAGTLGNHDVRVQGGRYEFGLLGMPRRYYRRRVGDVGIFLVDSNTLGGAQLRWLEHALRSSDAPWKVVAMHHPAFSCGGYLGDPRVRKLLVPLFDAHDHNYQRFAERNGVTYVVHGGGGAGLYTLRRCPSSFPRRVRAKKIHGWLYLRAGPGFLRVRAVGLGGGVRDRFTLYP